MSDIPEKLMADLTEVLGSVNFTPLQPYFVAPQQVVFPKHAFYFHRVKRISQEEAFVNKLYELFLANLEPGSDCTNFVIKKSPIQGVEKNTCAGTARAFENGRYTWRPRLTVSITSPYSKVEVHFTLGKNLKLNEMRVALAFIDSDQEPNEVHYSDVWWHTFEDFMNSYVPHFIPAFKLLSATNATSSDELRKIINFSTAYKVH